MSSNPQGESWFSDKVLENITVFPHILIDRIGQPTVEPPFRGPARIQGKKDYIPDDWEDDDGEDEGQTGPIPSTMLQAEADLPAQSQGSRGEKIKPPMCVHSVHEWLL